MCGICGFTGKHDKQFAHKVLQNMMQTMLHRGPDGEGAYYGRQITMGFRRLAIIDPEGGKQPFYNESGNIVSFCNGEIYNFRELREELLGKGHLLNSQSDAEVLVHAYEEWGESLTDHLRGMYAFVIWDSDKEKMLAVRDPFGIKPFYYAFIDGCMVFASEIKTILAYPGYQRSLNMEALEMYLSFQYSVLPETFFKGIYRLMPGSMLIRNAGVISIKQYFRPELFPAVSDDAEKITEYDLEAAIADSVRFHMRSDTEVGVLLSGGVDSIYLASLSGAEKAFTVGFEANGYNEIELASEIAAKLNMKHKRYLISDKEYWDSIPLVQYMMDEPLADASAAALCFLDGIASGEVKTVISGEGSDELFGGYPIYHEPLSLRYYQQVPKPIRDLLSWEASCLPDGLKGKSFLCRGALSLEERFIGNAYIFHPSEIRLLLQKDSLALTPAQLLADDYQRSKDKDDVTRMQEIDLKYWLWGDILLKADKMSMAHSIECRVPYLDKEVYKTASALTSSQKISGAQTKYLFRKVASQKIPVTDANRKKLGFPVPIRLWLRQEEWISKVRKEFREAPGSGYFHTNMLMKLIDEHARGKADHSRKIWTVYSFLQWYKGYFA